MRSPLVIVAALAAGLAVSACDMTATEREDEVAPPPSADEPVVEDVESEPAETEPTEPAAPPPPTDSGDLGEARPSEESVQPDSETIFY